MNLYKFDLKKVLAASDEELRLQHEYAAAMHAGLDIKAAGEQIEESFRQLLRKFFGPRCLVSDGHIVDSQLLQSPQLDVIISSLEYSSLFLVSKDQTSYLPYESVYAIGEVKTTYDSTKKPIQSFTELSKTVMTSMTREVAGPNYLGFNITLGDGLTQGDSRSVKNQLRRFMFFLQPGDFDLSALDELYGNTEPQYLPDIVVIGGLGFIVPLLLDPEGKVKSMVRSPGAGSIGEGLQLVWGMRRSNESGLGLAYLLGIISDTLIYTMLRPPKIIQYMNAAFSGGSAQFEAVGSVPETLRGAHFQR